MLDAETGDAIMGCAMKGKFRRIGASLCVSAITAVIAGRVVLAQTTRPKTTSPEAKAPKYLSPITIVADKAGKTIYIAQATAGSVAVFDVASRKVTATIDNGRAVTILDVLSKKHNPKDQHGETSNLSKQELADLAEYVLSL